uniref:Transposase MuDR plant domain-containing protein n=1 Tax=Chenopodium quinoa TaxID=63459 RepID=A0A803KM67_CHEQI
MVGSFSLLTSPVIDSSHTCPCICLETMNSSSMNLKNGGDVGLGRKSMGKKQSKNRQIGSLELSSSFVDSGKEFMGIVNKRSSTKQRKVRSPVIVSELGGQYEDNFEDVKTYFSFMDLGFCQCSFLVANKPGDGKVFIRNLGKEKQELAERIMVTRLHLYGKWIKKCDHGEIYQFISDENLELMRERLLETIIWPSDDTNTEKIVIVNDVLGYPPLVRLSVLLHMERNPIFVFPNAFEEATSLANVMGEDSFQGFGSDLEEEDVQEEEFVNGLLNVDGYGFDEIGEIWYMKKGCSLHIGRARIVGDKDIAKLLEAPEKDGFYHLYIVHEDKVDDVNRSFPVLPDVTVLPASSTLPETNPEPNTQQLMVTQNDTTNLSEAEPSGELVPAVGNVEENVEGENYEVQEIEEDNVELSDNDYEDKEDDDLFHEFVGNNEDIVDSDDEVVNEVGSDDEGPVYPEFNLEVDFKGKVVLTKGLKFPTNKCFRKALQYHAIDHGYDFYFLHNNNQRVSAYCAYKCGCPRKRARILECKCNARRK